MKVYQFDEMIGEGSYGHVYKATTLKMKRLKSSAAVQSNQVKYNNYLAAQIERLDEDRKDSENIDNDANDANFEG